MLRPFQPILAIYCLVLAFLFAMHPFHAYDTWWHLASGRWILEHGHVPIGDPFSYTAKGFPWINHEWGAGVLFWLLFSTFGATGCILAIGGLFWLVFYGMGRTVQLLTRSETVPYFVLFILGQLIVHRIMFRPHIFSTLFYVLLLFFLYQYRLQNPKPMKVLVLIPFMFLIWANLHGGVLVGLALLGLYWFVGLARSLYKKEDIDWAFFWVFLISALMILFNPFGFHIYTFPFEHGSLHNIMVATEEWIPPYDKKYIHLLVMQGYFALLVLTAIGLRFRRVIPMEALVLGLIPFILSIRWNRYSDFFAIWALPVLATQWREKFPKINTQRFQIFGMALSFALILFYVVRGGVPYTWMGGVDPFGFGIRPHTAPLGAVEFLQKNKIETRLYNDVESGGFLLFMGLKPFIDGRSPVYGDDFFGQQIVSQTHPEVFELLQKKWHFGVVFLSALTDIDSSPLHEYLVDSPHWELVYVDDATYIYLDDRPEHLPLWEKFRVTDSNVMRYLKWKKTR